jgi:mRNA-degrading endonuclease RelE of RelBE toxin-antitoxin system
MSEQSSIEVEASLTFNRNLRILAKKYRNIRSDIQPVVNQLKLGERPGEEIPGIGFEVFKVRVRNSNVQKGKSGGYRLIYYIKTEKSIILLTIYTKSEQTDVAADSLRSIIAEFEQNVVENEEEA